MTDDLKKARELLAAESYTCVLVKGNQIHTSRERGVKPLLQLLDAGANMTDFSAADKVIGKATAFLYCLLNVKEIYAPVISRSAAEVLDRHGIRTTCDLVVEQIFNHRRTGGCPMETAVREIDDPEAALAAVRETLKRMQ